MYFINFLYSLNNDPKELHCAVLDPIEVPMYEPYVSFCSVQKDNTPYYKYNKYNNYNKRNMKNFPEFVVFMSVWMNKLLDCTKKAQNLSLPSCSISSETSLYYEYNNAPSTPSTPSTPSQIDQSYKYLNQHKFTTGLFRFAKQYTRNTNNTHNKNHYSLSSLFAKATNTLSTSSSESAVNALSSLSSEHAAITANKNLKIAITLDEYSNFITYKQLSDECELKLKNIDAKSTNLYACTLSVCKSSVLCVNDEN